MFCFSDASQHPPIAGLRDHHLDFLGLVNCAYNACRRENLPALQVQFVISASERDELYLYKMKIEK